MERREFIHRSSGAAALGLAAASGLVPGQAAAQAGAGWNKTAFEAKSLADAVKALGGGTATESKNLVLAAEGLGKHKTLSQLTAIISILLLVAHPQWGAFGKLFAGEVAGQPWIWWLAGGAKWLAVGLTIVSGGTYLWRNRHVYLSDC